MAWSYSPNSEEALRLLSLPLPPTKPSIEQACKTFIDFGVGLGGAGWVIIRSGELGAFVACRSQPGRWIDPYWTTDEHVVDVTGKFLHGHLSVQTLWLTCSVALAYGCLGAGNSFLGGLAAGLTLRDGDVYEGTCSHCQHHVRIHVQIQATFFATISASYTIEQHGLPRITRSSSDLLREEWNDDSPWRRLQELKARYSKNDRN